MTPAATAAPAPEAKKTATRPYCVFEGGKMVALVRARSPERAIAEHNKDRFEAVVADADAMYTAAKEGFEIVDAG